MFALCFAGNFFRPRKARALLVRVLGWCGYLHTLNLVSLVGVSLVRVSWLVWLPARLEPCVLGSCALLVRVLVGVVTCMP